MFLSCVSIDAYDWVMATNIYIFSYAWKPASRKPYLSSSNYILKKIVGVMNGINYIIILLIKRKKN